MTLVAVVTHRAMKFRATMRDARTLLGVCNTIRSFAKRCILKLHASQIRIIAVPSDGDDAQLWTSCRTDTLFVDVRIEAKSSNAIYCEVPDVAQLVFALRSCDRASAIVVKLAKVDHRQLLTLSMQGAGGGHDTVHEVAIRVLTDAEIARITAPPLEADVAEVFFPPLADVAILLDAVRASACTTVKLRLQSESGGGQRDDLLLSAAPATGGGPTERRTMIIGSEGNTIDFSATFANIHAPPSAAPLTAPVEVAVDLKRLSKFLTVRDLTPTSVTAHMAHRRALVLSAFAHGDTNIVFYLPATMR